MPQINSLILKKSFDLIMGIKEATSDLEDEKNSDFFFSFFYFLIYLFKGKILNLLLCSKQMLFGFIFFLTRVPSRITQFFPILFLNPIVTPSQIREFDPIFFLQKQRWLLKIHYHQ